MSLPNDSLHNFTIIVITFCEHAKMNRSRCAKLRGHESTVFDQDWHEQLLVGPRIPYSSRPRSKDSRQRERKEKKRKNRRALEDATMICQMIYQVSYHLPRNVIVRLAWARLTSLFHINAARMHCRGANLLRSCFELIW